MGGSSEDTYLDPSDGNRGNAASAPRRSANKTVLKVLTVRSGWTFVDRDSDLEIE